MDKTFANINVGDILYWGSYDMGHITTTIVTDIHLELDGKHLPRCCDVTFTTNEGFVFTINKVLLDKHKCICFSHQVETNMIYVGTSKFSVANAIIKYIDNKLNFWESRKKRICEDLIRE